MEISPGLRNEVEAVAQAERDRGSRSAIRDLEKYGEITAEGIAAIRSAHYTIDQTLGDWFPPDAAGRASPQ